MNTKIESVHDAFGDVIGWGFQICDDEGFIIFAKGLFPDISSALDALQQTLEEMGVLENADYHYC